MTKSKKQPLEKVEHHVKKLSQKVAPSLYRYAQTAGGSVFDEIVARIFGSMARFVVYLESFSIILLQTLGNFYLLLGAVLVGVFSIIRKLTETPFGRLRSFKKPNVSVPPPVENEI